MMSELQVFLVDLADQTKIIVYSLDNPQTGNLVIFNAELLTVMKNVQVTGYTEISGDVTSKFGVKPIILGYENGKYELVYAPKGLGYVFKSDGKIARHNQIQVILKSEPIKVPDLDKVILNSKTNDLPEIVLATPDTDDINKYIAMSQQGIEYSTNLTYDELMKPKFSLPSSKKPIIEKIEFVLPRSQIELVISPLQQPPTIILPQIQPNAIIVPSQPTLPQLNNSALPQQFDIENGGSISPIPKIIKPKKISSPSVCIQTDVEIKELKIEVAELRSMLKALTQRIYQVYPVEMPQELRYNGKIGPIIDFDTIQKMMSDNLITGMVVEPLFQPYGGSHRGTNRILTFTDKEGKIYHVRADHDAKTNNIVKCRT
jgi:hypothetical protein